jgi:hypothetical protein
MPMPMPAPYLCAARTRHQYQLEDAGGVVLVETDWRRPFLDQSPARHAESVMASLVAGADDDVRDVGVESGECWRATNRDPVGSPEPTEGSGERCQRLGRIGIVNEWEAQRDRRSRRGGRGALRVGRSWIAPRSLRSATCRRF